MSDWAKNRQQGARAQRWRDELALRMSQADNPLTVTEEQKADVWEALLAHANDKLPAGHPAKWTQADVELLNRIRTSMRDLIAIDSAIGKLKRILPPTESDG